MFVCVLGALVLGPDPWYRMDLFWLGTQGPLGPVLSSDAGWCPCRGSGVRGAVWHVCYAHSVLEGIGDSRWSIYVLLLSGGFGYIQSICVSLWTCHPRFSTSRSVGIALNYRGTCPSSVGLCPALLGPSSRRFLGRDTSRAGGLLRGRGHSGLVRLCFDHV